MVRLGGEHNAHVDAAECGELKSVVDSFVGNEVGAGNPESTTGGGNEGEKKKRAGGDVVGAVGISGDTSENDEKCAVAGITAAGLKADPGVDPAA